MTEQKNKNLTRRDAMKLLGAAAGATLLANLPSKWSKPSLISGVLPAHAQTSCGTFAVFIEVLTGGQFALDFPILGTPTPDGGGGDGTPGSTAFWNCQTGCLFLFLDLVNGASGSVRITTLAGQFIENYVDGVNNFRDIVIDMGTGAYSNVPGGTAGSCTWPFQPEGIESQKNNRSTTWFSGQ